MFLFLDTPRLNATIPTQTLLSSSHSSNSSRGWDLAIKTSLHNAVAERFEAAPSSRRSHHRYRVSMHQMMHTLLIVAIGHYGSIASATSMIDQPKWNVKTTVGPDALTGGWFINPGRTGIRVRLLEERPTDF